MNDKKSIIDLSSPTEGQGVFSTGRQGPRDQWVTYIHNLQNRICSVLEEVDGKASFAEDVWERPEGGGGSTRIISNGNVFEKGGVNTSVVFGNVTDTMRSQLKYLPQGNKPLSWWACGLSVVIHPFNPFLPTVHCNYRMFELYGSSPLGGGREGAVGDRWFGGGTDLTPYYLFEEDAMHFHRTYKNVCDEFDPAFHNEFKESCDNYFVNTHRNNERRGIGGIFYDYKRPDEKHDIDFWMKFGKACGDAFLEAYIPIVQKREQTPYTQKHKHWQEIRRGRYVEFNLVHDRGTLFGLRTNGRTESILMSLPPTVRFEYNHEPEIGSEEDKLLQVCLQPKSWI